MQSSSYTIRVIKILTKSFDILIFPTFLNLQSHIIKYRKQILKVTFLEFYVALISTGISKEFNRRLKVKL